MNYKFLCAFLCFGSILYAEAYEASKIEAVKAGKITEARAEWWRKSTSKDQAGELQAALNSGAKKLIVSGKWEIGKTVAVPSNIELVLENGAEIRALPGKFQSIVESLVVVNNVKNVILRGSGVFRMNKKDYQDASRYKPAEWRHTLSLNNAENIRIEGLQFRESGGDGIYLNDVRNVTIVKVKCEDNHRQGISVISAENLLIEDSEFSGTDGTAPMAGIDFEPNRADEKLVRCVLRNCRFLNNKGSGVDLMLMSLNGTSAPVSITLENCEIRGNGNGIAILNGNEPPLKGTIRIENSRISGSKQYSFHSKGQSADGFSVEVKNCEFDLSGTSSPAFSFFAGKLSGPVGNFHLEKVTVLNAGSTGKLFEFDAWKTTPLRDMTGTIETKDGKGFSLADALKQSEKLFSSVKPSSWNPSRLQPASGKVDTSAATQPLRSRFGAQFVQYAKAGEKVAVRVTLSQIGKDLPTAYFQLFSPQGKLLAKWAIANDTSDKTLRFTASETGIYKIIFSGYHGVKLESDTPGNGILAQSGATFNHDAGRMYFTVPAGVGQVAVRVVGENASEWLSADLLDPSGKVVKSEKRVTAPTIFIADRSHPDKAEVWSVRVNSAVDDFTVTVFGDSIPVITSSPDRGFSQNVR